ncbi:MAG: hypothetical protein R3B48_29765 [Kofleriaceae bacterium]
MGTQEPRPHQARRGELLRLLRLAAPRQADLRELGHALAPAVVAAWVVEVPTVRTRALAERLVDDVLERDAVGALLDALEVRRPDLQGEIAAVRLSARSRAGDRPAAADGKIKRNPWLPARLQSWLSGDDDEDHGDGGALADDREPAPDIDADARAGGLPRGFWRSPRWPILRRPLRSASDDELVHTRGPRDKKVTRGDHDASSRGASGELPKSPLGNPGREGTRKGLDLGTPPPKVVPFSAREPVTGAPQSGASEPGFATGAQPAPQATADAGTAPTPVGTAPTPVGTADAPAPAVTATSARPPGAPLGGTRATGDAYVAPYVEPQIVCLGFARPARPEAPIIDRTLAAGQRYVLWVEIGPEFIAGSLQDVSPIEGVREGDELDVVLFAFPEQLALDEHRHGRVRIQSAGNRVVRAAWPETPPEIAEQTLCFAVTTPALPGRYALRCNVYCRGVLLQSHVVSAEVTAEAQERFHSLRRSVDYNLSARLDSGLFPPGADCRVSILLNDDGHGTHSFRFVSSREGIPEQIGDAHLEGAQLAKMVRYARVGLYWAAWGTEEPWTEADACKFTGGLDAARLAEALILLARRGANLWMQLAGSFAFVGDVRLKLREHMRVPGRVQIALKASADSVVPIALMYDYPFDAGLRNVTLCDAALAAIAAGRELAEEPCFRGECPHYEDRSVVCPAGFWGFRQELGLPLHLPGGEVATEIPRQAAVRAFAPISTDPRFALRDGHLKELEELADGWLEVLRDRAACLSRLKEARQLVYFYCHGGLTSSETPFLEVGDVDSDPILAESLFDAGVSWPKPLRPLVVLNGCHTTATSPDAMFSMLTAFATHCNAAGVVGTEITNFEPVASVFGRSLIGHFLGGVPLGRAVRLARLELLRRGNPLGLMYIPFALPTLRLS